MKQTITCDNYIESDDEDDFIINNITESNNCLSLANEIDSAILRENEKLKQELHEVKNNTSLFELQIEDDLKQKEEEFRSFKETQELKVTELEEHIKALEIRLIKEKDLNEQLILHDEEENLLSKPYTDLTPADRRCKECIILREETKNMISSIKSLESVISILQNENLELRNKERDLENSKSNYLNCHPTLGLQSNSQVTSNWEKVHYKNNKHFQTKIRSSKPSVSIRNSFDVFSNAPSDIDEVSTMDEEGFDKLDVITSKDRKLKRKPKSAQSVNHNNKNKNDKKAQKTTAKILLCADSHGRDLALHINNRSKSHKAVGFVRPGAGTKVILIEESIEREKLGMEDILLIMTGSNDIAKNEAKSAIDKISKVIKKFCNHKILLVNIPIRHDLAEWSCVNLEIKKTNKILKAMSDELSHVMLVDVSLANRKLHTRHGLHLNKRGKQWLADIICNAAAKSFIEEGRDVLQSDAVNDVEILEEEKEPLDDGKLPTTIYHHLTTLRDNIVTRPTASQISEEPKQSCGESESDRERSSVASCSHNDVSVSKVQSPALDLNSSSQTNATIK